MKPSVNFWTSLKKPILIQAPMEDVTDTVFRQIIARCGKPDVFLTEFTNVEGICSKGREKVGKRLIFTPIEHPIVAQIWGNNPKNYFETAKLIKDMGFDGIDINMGCPEKAVVKKGSCAALINNHQLAEEIILATREGAGSPRGEAGRLRLAEGSLRPAEGRLRLAEGSLRPTEGRLRLAEGSLRPAEGGLPISVKTRIGVKNIQTEEWASFLLNLNLDALTIHGRTAAEMSDVPAHWDEIGKAVKLRDAMKVKTLIIGNGDIKSREDAMEKYKKYKVDGIMIGRAIFNNLWIYNKNIKPENISYQEKLKLLIEHIKLFDKTWGSASRRNKNFSIMKKFYKIYVSGRPDATIFRNKLMEFSSASETLKFLNSNS